MRMPLIAETKCRVTLHRHSVFTSLNIWQPLFDTSHRKEVDMLLVLTGVRFSAIAIEPAFDVKFNQILAAEVNIS